MEWDCKNRRRCNISKKRIIQKKLYFLFIGIFFVLLCALLNVYYINTRLNEIFGDYLDVEVKKISNNIVSKAVTNYISKESYEEFIILNNNDSGLVNKISYNTEKINHFSSEFSKYLDNILLNLDNGSIDNYYLNQRLNNYNFVGIKNGLLCNISLGSINGSTLFSGFGPKIPIKISFSSNINTDVDIQSEEYGINNVIIKIYLVITINNQAILPLTSNENEIVIREPIAVDIIKGEIPNYYGFVN